MMIEPKHHYRWNHYFQMWMHTGIVHFVDDAPPVEVMRQRIANRIRVQLNRIRTAY